MKHFLFLLIGGLLAITAANAQRITIENRDGKAVIITRDTLPSGETHETVDWKADPVNVLTKQLEDVDRQIEWIDGKIERLQSDKKTLMQEKKDIEQILFNLEQGMLIEEKNTQPAPSEPKQPKKPAKKSK